jgi:hypothetical protein
MNVTRWKQIIHNLSIHPTENKKLLPRADEDEFTSSKFPVIFLSGAF